MNRIRLALALTAFAALAAACSGGDPQPSGDAGCPPVQVSGPDGQPLDLSGAWSGNDTGLYYIKQLGSCIWWSGLSNFDGQYPGQEWIMTFRGTIDADGKINGDFVDVKSSNPGSGTMTIEARIDQVNGQGTVQLYRMASTGHEIGVTFWQRAPEPAPTEVPAVTTLPSAAPS
ncbi:MAG: hypothetical protein QOJ81_961 [Chloroflexota bacterium]|jgi:hypothetical protein|nr:hypothetical protein [Chloroflexota bacterium]